MFAAALPMGTAMEEGGGGDKLDAGGVGRDFGRAKRPGEGRARRLFRIHVLANSHTREFMLTDHAFPSRLKTESNYH